MPSVNLVGSVGGQEQGKPRFSVVNIKAIQESSSVCALGCQRCSGVHMESCSDQGVEWEELLRSLLQSGDFQVSQPSVSALVVGAQAALALFQMLWLGS